MTDRDLTVGIVSYNTRNLTCQCVGAAIEAIGSRRASVVVADNGSADGTLEAVGAAYPAVGLLSCMDNPGYGESLNRVLAHFPAPFLLAMNADVFLSRNTLDRLLAYLADHGEVALVGPSLVGPDGTKQIACKRFPTLGSSLAELIGLERLFPSNPWRRRYYYSDVSFATAAPVESVCGATMLIRGDALARIGGFDSGFWMYFEDVDLCRRLWAAGYQVAFCPDVSVTHVHAASSRQTTARQVAYYLSYERYAQRHLSLVAARIIRLAIQLSTVLRMVALVGKYAPTTPTRRRELIAKLAACRTLLRRLRSGAPLPEAAP